uniref:Uncharacterized protein n=1 Tax=Rhizophora mucronata TaxID=61149 RepID=A0A2P2QNY0_RHIMU
MPSSLPTQTLIYQNNKAKSTICIKTTANDKTNFPVASRKDDKESSLVFCHMGIHIPLKIHIPHSVFNTDSGQTSGKRSNLYQMGMLQIGIANQ